MLNDRIEAKWIDAFELIFQYCKVDKTQSTIILSETQSRDLNVHLAELALNRIGVPFYHIKLPTPINSSPAIIRSSGSSLALTGKKKAVEALSNVDFIVDLTVEGLMHSPETMGILQAGARIMNISNEHPDILSRNMPDQPLKERTLAASRLCRKSKLMKVTSDAGTSLSVNMANNNTVGVWGWTDKPGTLAHWPGGIVVSFPKPDSVNGRLVFQPGDMNLTFKKYFESEVIFTINNDFVTKIDGNGSDAKLMKNYFEAFGDKECYATSHVGWGLSETARYEALTMYDKRDLNGTELRSISGNFLYSTGANEFAGRFTEGHFDLPMMECTITLDDVCVVKAGKLVS